MAKRRGKGEGSIYGAVHNRLASPRLDPPRLVDDQRGAVLAAIDRAPG